ncbi:MAG: F0F1 ATP synthase subunit gamma [Pseudomonadota bacterium]|nr:F0F1 ATP synthase subunit gamma [Pseudomonadota bacterium]
MSGEKEIRTQIKSIQSTQKITKAMEMVAASKMRRAQERMLASRPYAQKMSNVIGHLAMAHPEYCHPYLIERETVNSVGFIVISTDRGLCGGLNINLFKAALREVTEWKEKGAEISFCLIGTKANSFFRRFGAPVLGKAEHLGDRPRISDLIGPIKIMLDAYDEGKIDRLFLVENVFVNTMTQTPRVKTLVPVARSPDEELKHHWDYLYEPDSREVLDGLLMRYVESLVYQGVVENIGCEMAARMVAMKAATDNAGSLIDELQLIYNKARQASITQELSEIVGGAAAV